MRDVSERVMRRCGWIVALAAPLVPRARREDWRREWRAELWHECRRLERLGRLDAAAERLLLRQCLGSVADALAVRRFHPGALGEDFASAAAVVFRSPGAAGVALVHLAVAVAVDTVAVSVLPFARFAPPELRAGLIALTVGVVVLLAAAAAIAAATVVGQCEARRRAEALRRAMGVGRNRLRRQRALEGLLVSLLGGVVGLRLALALVEGLRGSLAASGAGALAADFAPRASVLALGMGWSVMLALLTALAPRLLERRRAGS